jgi:divalent metal cation (Fe/Co/Zn/Cd) transporter
MTDAPSPAPVPSPAPGSTTNPRPRAIAPTRPAPERRRLLERRVRWIVAATITYNVVEAVVAITAGRVASSAALVGFGLDSVVEVLSAAAVAWQFAAPDPHRRERAAMRLIAISFFGLALFVSADAARTLLGAAEPDHSTVGIVLAALSLAIMPLLSWFERRTGQELGSASAVADSRQTLLCAYLSAVLLVGLLLNSTLGWTWADPIAALVIAAVAIKEGVEAWRGAACCAPGAALRQPEGATPSGMSPGVTSGVVGPTAGSAPGVGGCSCGGD